MADSKAIVAASHRRQSNGGSFRMKLTCFRHDVFAQLLARFSEFKKRRAAHLDQATVNAELSRDFERRWSEPDRRESMVPGTEVLARLNVKLQGEYGVTITDGQIAGQFSRDTTPADVADLLEMLQLFGATDPLEA